MIDITGIPNVGVATAELAYGEMNDVATPGDGTGTPVRKDIVQDITYFLYALMQEAGITANNVPEGVLTSQGKDSLLRIARKQAQGPSYSNLLVKRNVGTPNSRVDVTYDKLWIEGVEDTTGSFTIDITASGLLGLDTGAEAADAWYYIWVIAKTDGTVSAILSASSTSPTMPVGYTLKRLVSMVRNTSGNFVDFLQIGNKIVKAPIQFVIGGNQTVTYIGVDISVIVPDYKTINMVYGNCDMSGITPAAGDAIFIASNSLGLGVQSLGLPSTYSAGGMSIVFSVPLFENKLYYKVSRNVNIAYIGISSFEINI